VSAPAGPVTLAQLRRGPAAVDVTTAAAALGIGRSTLYDAIRAGHSPVRVIPVGRRRKVVTAELVALLEARTAAT
jgi:excisionase family DNA binding protein